MTRAEQLLFKVYDINAGTAQISTYARIVRQNFQADATEVVFITPTICS